MTEILERFEVRSAAPGSFADRPTSAQVRLERYARRVSGMLFGARLHAHSQDVALALQRFLDVPKRRASLELLERNPDITLRQAVQVAVYQVLSLPAFEKILGDIVASAASHAFDSGLDMLAKMKQYIDHLQACLLEGCYDHLVAVALRRKPTIPEDDLHAILSSAIRRQIETEIFVPLMDKLHDLLHADIDATERALAGRCQGRKRVIQRRFNVGVLVAISERNASTL